MTALMQIHNVIELFKESEPQASAPALVPNGCVFDIKLCLKPTDEFAR